MPGEVAQVRRPLGWEAGYGGVGGVPPAMTAKTHATPNLSLPPADHLPRTQGRAALTRGTLEVIDANAGGPYGSAALAGVQADC